MTETERNKRIKAVEEQMEKLKKELQDIRNTELSEWDFSAWDNYPTMLMREYACKIPVESEFAEQFTNKLVLFTNLTRFKYCYDKDYVPDWSDQNESKWYVYFHTLTKEYKVDWTITWDRPSTVYFNSEEIAQKCANWLNAGCPKE